MKFTLIKSEQPKVVTKKYFIEDGRMKKETVANINIADYEVIDIPFGDLKEFLEGLKDNEAITLGYPVGFPTEGKIVPKSKVTGNSISRTLTNFKWNLDDFMLVFDFDELSDIRLEELLEKMYLIDGGLRTAAKVIRYSSSAFIEAPGISENTGMRGIHMFVHVKAKNVLDVNNYVKSLETKAWLEGLGHFKISTSGAILPRYLMDTSVFSPERLVFEAGVTLGEGVVCTENRSQGYMPGIQYEVKELVLSEKATEATKLSKESILRREGAREYVLKDSITQKIKWLTNYVTTHEPLVREGRIARGLYDLRVRQLSRYENSGIIPDTSVVHPETLVRCNDGETRYIGEMYFRDFDGFSFVNPLRTEYDVCNTITFDSGALRYKNKSKIRCSSRVGPNDFEVGYPTDALFEFYGVKKTMLDTTCVDQEAIVRIGGENHLNNLDEFSETIVRFASGYVRLKGEYYKLNSERPMKPTDVIPLLSSEILSVFDYKFSHVVETKAGDVMVALSGDSIRGMQQIFLNAVPCVDTLTMSSSYKLRVFEAKVNGNTADFIRPMPLPIKIDVSDVDVETQNEIVTWYLTEKFPELYSFIIEIIANGFDVSTAYAKLSIKILQAVSNFGKTMFFADIFRMLGVASTMNAIDLIALTGRGKSLGAGNALALMAPLVLIDEAADLNKSDSEAFFEALKEFRTGIFMNSKYQSGLIVKGNQNLVFGKMNFEALDTMHTEQLNRIIKLNSGKNTETLVGETKWSFDLIKRVIGSHISEVWHAEYNKFLGMTMKEREVYAKERIFYNYDPGIQKDEVQRRPVGFIYEMMSGMIGGILQDNTKDQHDEGIIYSKGKIYIQSKLKVKDYIFHHLDLPKGVIDDVYLLIDVMFDSKESKYQPWVTKTNFKGDEETKQLKCNWMINLSKPAVDVSGSYNEILNKIAEDPGRFKENPWGYLQALHKFSEE